MAALIETTTTRTTIIRMDHETIVEILADHLSRQGYPITTENVVMTSGGQYGSISATAQTEEIVG